MLSATFQDDQKRPLKIKITEDKRVQVSIGTQQPSQYEFESIDQAYDMLKDVHVLLECAEEMGEYKDE